ncbi:glycosyltransferase family 4 protein [Streptococcus sp. DD12]|uniref:glycosyltransferase family 4 protein n=1 Tax=Streptococcus sp. DD12 TaxID=1777880 RepID=UPI003FA69D5C
MIEIILVLIGTFLTSLILTPLVRFLAFRIGAVDNPNARRINKVPMPSAGGLAIVAAFALACLVYMPWALQGHAAGGRFLHYVAPILLAGGVIALTGLVDDVKELAPRMKLAGITLAAVLIWFLTDFHFDSFKVPFGGPMLHFGPFVSFCFTILWIVGITNAINLIDGLDGLVCGVSMISLGTMGLVSYFFLFGKDLMLTMTIFLLLSAILGFFPYNYHPAIIYLGDTGALFIGFMISVLSLQGLKNATAVAVITPVIILGVPVIDTAFAILRRKLSGRKISEADNRHLHHRLLAMGFTHRGAVLVVYGISIFFSLVSLLLNVSSRVGGVLLVIGLVIMVELFIEQVEIMGPNRTPLLSCLKFIGNSSYRQEVVAKWKAKH